MSIKSWIASWVASVFLGPTRANRARQAREKKRKRDGRRHVVEYFHQIDDPYSHLALQALVQFELRYDTEIRVWLVGEPEDWAAPERPMLIDYARHDACILAKKAGFSFEKAWTQPESGQVTAAKAKFAQALNQQASLKDLVALSMQLWSGPPFEGAPSADLGLAACAQGGSRRTELGHFMSAMLYYEGEWYWGIDRLHYLEQRLTELCASTSGRPKEPFFAPPSLDLIPSQKPASNQKTIHWYLSFRSPYTYISGQRVKALADAYGAELKLAFVLPMVMRGLPVPQAKGRYFSWDTAREARRLGIPFGKIADPVGKPVERGYAILPWAISQGRGFEFCDSFMTHVWSQGVDAGSDEGMKTIVETAGLSWDEAKPRLQSEDWRAEAEANRLEMFEKGCWGVPSFRVDDVCIWGQDRLWVIEDMLRS